MIIPPRQMAPAGSLIYSHATRGHIGEAGGEQSFVLQMDASQTLTITVTSASSLQPVVQVYDPAGALIGTATAEAPGGVAVLQTVPIEVAGEFTVRIGGAGDSAGSYSVESYLNAAIEAEPLKGITNDSIATAQSIDASFITLPGGGGRGGVVGSISVDQVIFEDDFERAELGLPWTITLGGRGRLELTSAQGAASGTTAMWSDRSEPGHANTATVNRAVLTQDLDGNDMVNLVFSHAETGDFEAPFQGPFQDYAEADGIAISADGVTWHPIFDAPHQPDGVWQQFVLNLSALAAESGIELGPDFRIQFQQSGNNTIPFNGRGWDGVMLAAPNTQDVYRFHLEEGETANLNLTRFSDFPVDIELLGENGVVLATGVDVDANIDHTIRGFVAPADGDYFIRVTGQVLGQYSLVVTRDALFSLEPHDTRQTAQPLATSGVVMGVAGYDMGRLFAYDNDLGANRIIELDANNGQILHAFPSPVLPIGAMATTGTSVLAIGRDGGPIYELDPDDGSILRTLDRPLETVGGLAYLRGEIFARSANQILILDYNTGAVKRIIDALGSSDLVATSEGIVVFYGKNEVMLVDPASRQARFLGEIRQWPHFPGGLAVNDNELLISLSEEILAFDLHTHELKRRMDLEDLDIHIVTLGGDGSFGADWYRFDTLSGDTLNISTATPAAGPMAFDNSVDPVVELYGPDGTLLAIADNNAADGRNAVLDWHVQQGGEYAVKVFAGAGSGEYVLAVEGSTAAPRPFRVSNIDPPDGGQLDGLPDQIRVQFDAHVLISSIQPSDLTVDGVAAAGFTVVDGRTIAFAPPSSVNGVRTVAIAPGALVNLQGTPIEAFESTFEHALEVQAISPLGSLMYELAAC